jgi:hypothetical protein
MATEMTCPKSVFATAEQEDYPALFSVALVQLGTAAVALFITFYGAAVALVMCGLVVFMSVGGPLMMPVIAELTSKEKAEFTSTRFITLFNAAGAASMSVDSVLGGGATRVAQAMSASMGLIVGIMASAFFVEALAEMSEFMASWAMLGMSFGPAGALMAVASKVSVRACRLTCARRTSR